MQTEPPSVEVRFTYEFERRLRTLAKKYRQIHADVQPLIEQLQAGETPGDQISGTGTKVFKARVKNSDIRKGKSAGYRLIYQVQSPTSILLLTIYSKSDQADISAAEIHCILAEFEQQSEGEENEEE